MTAAELMSKLRADPAFVAKRAQEEEERQRRAAEWRRAEEPLVKELRAAGVDVRSVWDLVNTTAPYTAALPILLTHLQHPYPEAVREGIARALAVPEAKFAWKVLLRVYRQEKEQRAKDGLAVAIAAVANEEVIDDVVSLARDAQLGPSRLLLLGALERSVDPRAGAALEELAADPELKDEIRAILRRVGRTGR